MARNVFTDIREMLGLTQAEIGRRIGRDASYWSRLERGRSPRLSEVTRICTKLGLDSSGVAKRALAAAVDDTPKPIAAG